MDQGQLYPLDTRYLLALMQAGLEFLELKVKEENILDAVKAKP